jgi:hypothetical protein
LNPVWRIAQANVRHSPELAAAKISVIVVYVGSFGAEPKSISISFILLPSMVCVPRAVAILGFAIVEDESFVAFLKHVLNAIRWGFLAIGPTPFEIGFTVNATFVWNGKYEVVAL